MCLWVEKAHLRELLATVDEKVNNLRKKVPQRSKEFLLQLPSSHAEPAIIFRDFPKSHGNLIQRAVGIALQNHPGGYPQTSAKFNFLSGLSVEVDNFFMSSDGRIFLFETKRDHSKIREDGVAGRNLWVTKDLIETSLLAETGRRLRHPITIAYFSYTDESFGGQPRPHSVNIGTKSTPHIINMPIYSRQDINNLIGPCFGQFIGGVDLLIAQKVVDLVPDLAIRSERISSINGQVPFNLNDLYEEIGDDRILIGDEPKARRLMVDDILAD